MTKFFRENVRDQEYMMTLCDKHFPNEAERLRNNAKEHETTVKHYHSILAAIENDMVRSYLTSSSVSEPMLYFDLYAHNICYNSGKEIWVKSVGFLRFLFSLPHLVEQ